MKEYKEEFLASSEVHGNKVSLFRKLEWKRKSRYTYYIHWGEVKSEPKTRMELLTPKGNDYQIGGAIKQFFQAIEAAKQVTFSKI